MYKLITIYIYH